MNFLRDLSVLVLGLGESGLAMVRWCVRHGAQVQVWDSREHPPHAQTLAQELPAVQRLHGALGEALPAGVKLVLKSPGLAPHDTRIAPLLHTARSTGVPVMAELDLFVHGLADLKAATAATAVAVDGTPVEAALESPAEAALDVPAEAELEAPLEASAEPDVAAAAETPEGERPLPIAPPPPPAPDPGYSPQLLVVTGTNGKTTTTALTALLVERAGRRVAVAGNIMPTLLDRLLPLLDQPRDTWPEVWVLELSSFQLADAELRAGLFEPTAAALLNLSQDHADWHGSAAAYAQAKARVFAERAVLVINHDDAGVEALVPAPVRIKGPRGRFVEHTRQVLRFGSTPPERPGDFGLVVENGMAWLVRALPADETVKRRKGEDEEIHLQRLMPADALRIRGRHNAANALAALALATAAGCPLAPMLHGLREYTGEPHRLQWVATVGGIDAFDDSKGTNVGATVAALDGLGVDKAPARLVLILGGDGKGQDFAPLAGAVARHARAVALIGRDAALIETALAGCGVPLQHHADLPAAVGWCFAQARPGDAVLLSPACASLDMFRNYVHRGEVFAEAVRALAAERGEALA